MTPAYQSCLRSAFAQVIGLVTEHGPLVAYQRSIPAKSQLPNSAWKESGGRDVNRCVCHVDFTYSNLLGSVAGILYRRTSGSIVFPDFTVGSNCLHSRIVNILLRSCGRQSPRAREDQNHSWNERCYFHRELDGEIR